MKKINNKILIVVFVVLALILAFTKLFLSPARSSNFTATFEIDTARITEIKLRSQKDSMIETTLTRKAALWTVSHKDLQAGVPIDKMKGLLAVLKQLKPERVVSRKKEKWSEYEVNDSTSSRVHIFDKETSLLVLHIGKTSGTTTFVRLADGDEVYAVDGDLQASINKPFKDWRNQTLTRFEKNAISKVEFHYPADSSFTLEKKNKIWMVNDKPVDSVKVDAYLGKVSYQDFDSFADRFTPGAEPNATVIFKSTSNGEVYVKGWKQGNYWVLNSSLQPSVYFLDGNLSKVNDIMIGAKAFEK